MKTVYTTFISLLAISLILTLFFHPAWIILTSIVLTYAGLSFFTHSVEADEAAFVKFGGKVIGTVGPGFHLIPAWIMKLEVFDRKFQIILHPGNASHEGQEYRCNLQPLALRQKNGENVEALERVAVFTPVVVLNIKVDEDNMAALAESGGVDEAVDLACEIITGALQEIVGKLTLKRVIELSIKIQRVLTRKLKEELLGKGLKIDGQIRFTDMGIPKAIAESAERAAAAENKATEDRTAGKAAADVKVQMAKAEREAAEEKSKGDLALAEAKAKGTKALVAALPGNAKLKAEVLKAQATGMQTLPDSLGVLVIGGDGKNTSAADTAATIAAVATATTESKKPKP